MALEPERREVWRYQSGEAERHPMQTMWRILHLLGNAWIHNTLVGLGKGGLTFAELRFFLCREVPKRTAIHPKLKETKEFLSDKPALEFYLPPYPTRAHLAADLRKLSQAGYIMRSGDQWCLRMEAYWDIVNEWERDHDEGLMRDYCGEELIRVDHHTRIYGLARKLLTEKEREQLDAIGKKSISLVAEAFKIQHCAKVRAWKAAKHRLESAALPKSISSRLLNLFWHWEINVVLPDRVWQPDTPRLISLQMLDIKDSQLLRREMKRTIEKRSCFETAIKISRKYTSRSSTVRRHAAASPDDTQDYEMPRLAHEPPFIDDTERDLFRNIMECVCDPQLQSGERMQRIDEIAARGIPGDLVDILNKLWQSSMKNITLVATSPVIPLVENPTYWISERNFLDHLP